MFYFSNHLKQSIKVFRFFLYSLDYFEQFLAEVFFLSNTKINNVFLVPRIFSVRTAFKIFAYFVMNTYALLVKTDTADKALT